MKALSVRQPYAWLIVNGHKDIENRDWATNFRGRVLIHAGLTYPKRDHRADAEIYDARFGNYPERETMLGGIVGVATITGCVTASDSEWFFGPYGFTLIDAKPLPFVPCKGKLGFFNVDADVAEQLRQLHTAGEVK
ncbi:ASCH domain-containing protein [Caballeronia sp. dw_19]|uniref:ASCH domain-containing protein n=1 Tax=Caballeronia sp. dw_19 TaxID=2719791 RepID=UPI001BCE5ACB|nr:ASCH domain-containing protein [Caballeronia sp. dw_19]